MKKQYMKPTMGVVKIEKKSTLLVTSGGVNSTLGIDYGGIDNGGTQIPE